MNVIFTCGGTGGHINPAIAVANTLKERHPDCNILFIGGEGYMEEKLVPQAGFELICLPGSGLSRKLNLAGIKKNVHAVKCVLSAVSRCKKIIKEFGADVIVGTGGYASFPALMAGHQMKVPTVVHESNALPGLTTKMAAQIVDRVLVCFEESKQYYKHPEAVEAVGMPVRKEFFFGERNQARKELGVEDNKPLVVSTFGSQGARMMNLAMADLFALEQAAGYPYQHIHATGSFGWEWMPEKVAQKGVYLSENKGITMQEYIYNMPTLMAAADVVISRAGASSCNEIAASGTPCILIPSPNVTDNHQEKNARALSDNGAAVLLLEKDCAAETLRAEIEKLISDPQYYQGRSKALLKLSVPDSAEKLCDIIEQSI